MMKKTSTKIKKPYAFGKISTLHDIFYFDWQHNFETHENHQLQISVEISDQKMKNEGISCVMLNFNMDQDQYWSNR